MVNGKTNLAFLGEAGCGKSEIALNFAMQLARRQEKPVHFFDMDQTKPLYRSRDAKEALAKNGIALHYETQYLDAPTVVGGVRERLKDDGCYTILDIGGNAAGARMVGGFAKMLNADASKIFYVVNPFRPWSRDILAIDATLTSILNVSHVQSFHILCNPNLGAATTPEECTQGYARAQEMLGDYISIAGTCVRDAIYTEAQKSIPAPLLPLKLYLPYEWADDTV